MAPSSFASARNAARSRSSHSTNLVGGRAFHQCSASAEIFFANPLSSGAAFFCACASGTSRTSVARTNKQHERGGMSEV
jgi:hypothetical protein